MNYSDVIPGLIGLIPRINISNVMLADTVMYTIGTRPPELLTDVCSYLTLTCNSPPSPPGSLAEWLADHPVMLAGILPMVLEGLMKAELSVSSVSTLKRICRECKYDLGSYAHDILGVSQVRFVCIYLTINMTTGMNSPSLPSAGRTGERGP